jgi:hypothetical protein
MSTTFKVPGIIVTTLATVALVAPAAGAMPLHESSEFDAGHASTATAAKQKQDFRSADARDAAIHPKQYVGSSHRQYLGSTFSGPYGASGVPAKTAPGQPNWASHPQPVHALQAPATSDDDGFPWAIVLGVAGIGLIGGGAAVGISHSGGRRTRRERVAA